MNISFNGTGNIIVFCSDESGCLGRFRNCEILLGDRNFVLIANTKFTIRNLHIVSSTAKDCSVEIGRNFSCGDCLIQVAEGNSVNIGSNCMFAGGIEIRNSDFHAIYNNLTKELLNRGSDVIIEEHVWVAFGVKILKGVKVSRDSVVGAGSVVTKKFNASNVIIAGNPARIIKTDINWTRTSPLDYESS